MLVRTMAPVRAARSRMAWKRPKPTPTSGRFPAVASGLASASGELLTFSVNPGRAALDDNGLVAEGVDTGNGQIVQICSASACVDASAGTADGSQTDTPLGWLDGELIYERMSGDTVEYRAIRLVPGSLDVADDRSLGTGGREIESIARPYPVDGALLVPARDAWLRVTTAGAAVIDENPYGVDLALIRVDPASNTIGYVTGGSVMVASLDRPGSPYASVPFRGTDFDLAPDGSAVAIISGSGIEVIALDGTPLAQYPNDTGLSLGGISWEPSGLFFVDYSSGVIRVIRP